MEKKNVVIYVAGQRFSLCTEDTVEYVTEIGERVDLMIKGIAKDNPRLNRDACATLAALDLCDDEAKARRKLESLRVQVVEYLASAEELRRENAQLRAEVDRLSKELKEKQAAILPMGIPIIEQGQRLSEEQVEALLGRSSGERRDLKKDKKGKKGKGKDRYTGQKPFIPVAEPSKEAEARAEEAVDTNASPEDDKGLPEEPPFQFSIFDTDILE